MPGPEEKVLVIFPFPPLKYYEEAGAHRRNPTVHQQYEMVSRGTDEGRHRSTMVVNYRATPPSEV